MGDSGFVAETLVFGIKSREFRNYSRSGVFLWCIKCFFGMEAAMEERFAVCKRAIERDSKINHQITAGVVRRLQQFGDPFFQDFRRSATRDNALIFLEGLLFDLPRKIRNPSRIVPSRIAAPFNVSSAKSIGITRQCYISLPVTLPRPSVQTMAFSPSIPVLLLRKARSLPVSLDSISAAKAKWTTDKSVHSVLT
jgi:hypothetical protein